MNPQLKGHLLGAVNNGATIEQVRAVRNVAVRVCEEAGMRVFPPDDDDDGDDGKGEMGWRGEVANL